MLQNASQASNTYQLSTSASIVSVCVECSKSTKSICIECGMGYCESCFGKVHSAGVVFKKHKLKHLDAKCSAIGSPLGLCNAHSKKMTHYCQACTTPICGMCVSTSHRMHNTKELAKVVSSMILFSSLICSISDRPILFFRMKKYASTSRWRFWKMFVIWSKIRKRWVLLNNFILISDVKCSISI